MNTSLKALSISLAFHGAFLFLVYALSTGLAEPGKPIRIDFTLNDPAPGPPSRKAPGPESPKKAAPAPARLPRKAPQRAVANRPRIAEPVPLAPATEKAGPVPIVAAHRETLPVPGASYSNEGGTKTGGAQVPAAAGITGGGDGAGGGGGGGGAEQLRSRYRREHFEYIRKIIQENIIYPQRAQRNGWQGRVVVMFSVMRDGKVKDIRIRKSSGYDMLDDNVMETIRKVEPFPKPPVSVELIIPIAYTL